MSRKSEHSNEKRTNYAYDPQKIALLRQLAAERSTALKPLNMSMLLDEALDDLLAKYGRHPNGSGRKGKTVTARG